MRRKKILVTIDWFLPGTASGGPVRSYANMMDHFIDDFEFYVITRNTDFGSDVPYPNITPNTWVQHEIHIHVYYIDANNLTRAHLKRVLEKTDFDMAFVNGIYSGYFSILPVILLKRLEKPIMVSARGMLNSQAFSVKHRRKKLFLTLSKLVKLYKGVKFHATNEDEAQSIKNEIGSSAEVIVAPNLARKQIQKAQTTPVKNNPVRFVNIARISVEKGTLKMLEGMQEIKAPLELDLYGPMYDERYWDKCLDRIAKLPNNIKVSYKGVLESDAVPLSLQRYDFFVLLSEGENFGHAILEALSVGLPVIISDKTPWKALEVKGIGWDISPNDPALIAQTFEHALALTNHDYLRWSEAACHFAKAFIENPEVLEQNKALFLNAINT